MDSLEFSAAYYEWKTKVSPPFFKEGWLRPPFSLMVLSLCGDGVVKTESGWYFHHLPQIHGKKIPVYQNGSHGFGYSSSTRRRIFQFTNDNQLQKINYGLEKF